MVVEVPHDILLDPIQIPVHIRGRPDADEHRAVALGPEADGAEERVQNPLGAARVELGALRHDRVRRRGELDARGHEEAVVVALRPVHGRQRTAACEEAERDDPGDHADDDQHDLAKRPSAAPLLGEHGRLRGLLRDFRSWGRLRLGRRARLGPSLVEPERRVLVAHQEHVGGDARDPAVEPEYKVEDSAWVAGGEEEPDPREEDEDADQAGLEAESPCAVVRARRRVAPSPEEDADDDVLGDREQPPLHEHEAA